MISVNRVLVTVSAIILKQFQRSFSDTSEKRDKVPCTDQIH